MLCDLTHSAIKGQWTLHCQTRHCFPTKIANNDQNGNLKLLKIDNSKSLPKKEINVKKSRAKCHKNYAQLGDEAEN